MPRRSYFKQMARVARQATLAPPRLLFRPSPVNLTTLEDSPAATPAAKMVGTPPRITSPGPEVVENQSVSAVQISPVQSDATGMLPQIRPPVAIGQAEDPPAIPSPSPSLTFDVPRTQWSRNVETGIIENLLLPPAFPAIQNRVELTPSGKPPVAGPPQKTGPAYKQSPVELPSLDRILSHPRHPSHEDTPARREVEPTPARKLELASKPEPVTVPTRQRGVPKRRLAKPVHASGNNGIVIRSLEVRVVPPPSSPPAQNAMMAPSRPKVSVGALSRGYPLFGVNQGY